MRRAPESKGAGPKRSGGMAVRESDSKATAFGIIGVQGLLSVSKLQCLSKFKCKPASYGSGSALHRMESYARIGRVKQPV